MLFAGLRLVRMVKNCDLGLANAAAAFSRPRSQFFTIWTSQPANNIYILTSEDIDDFTDI